MASSRSLAAARRAVPLVFAGWLGACAGDPQAAFDLAPAASLPHRAIRAQVHVLDPIATPDLDSDRILVRTGPDALAVMAGARWAAPMPMLLQARLAESLQNAQAADIGNDGGKAAVSEYNLETDVREFELDANDKLVTIEIAVKLVSARDNHIVAVRSFKTRTPVASTDVHVVTSAMAAALSGLMAQIVAFVATSS